MCVGICILFVHVHEKCKIFVNAYFTHCVICINLVNRNTMSVDLARIIQNYEDSKLADIPVFT